ncbi:PKD domain-containing protein [Danxiaibacter flavus]|uniref:PKD domain-containing protein n=1 Tax=Danxiaibacter flavus TaxID=3049108 RepID=A0ABV3ZGA4_9BACT|nr:PKD domain-containing protein [Chitinophagaceae bacterium DXS]
MKRLIPLFLLLSMVVGAYARHGKGGSLSYTYLGVGSSPNTSKYSVVVQHYVNCDLIGNELFNIILGVYDAGSSILLRTISVSRSSAQTIQKQQFNGCINPVPVICFYLATYSTVIELPDNNAGYVLTEQECCRAAVILNISNPTSVGFTYMNTIPGVINGVVYRNNSSPILALKDTAVICHNAPFMIDFGATDKDHDSLSYSFCEAFASGVQQQRQADPPLPPPYASVPYNAGFSGSSPMGNSVRINSKTGIISGTAPATTGAYVIAVCIDEFRKGVQIGSTKKEVLITVADCSLTAAALDPLYINCSNSTFNFENQSMASNITAYYWDFGVKASTSDTSSEPTPTYTYKDTGTYILKLRVSSSSGCSDSTTSTVKVYPGFTPAFSFTGSCYQAPFNFSDRSYAAYGSINSWFWDFGDESSSLNTATTQNATHQYTASGTRTATLQVTSTKGCSGSASKNITVNDKPEILLPFKDTLICADDKLPIVVTSTGNIATWTPNYNIINTSSLSTVVYPTDTTVYTITVRELGCVDSASLKVNVVDHITVKLSPDTSFCKGDSSFLHPVSDALAYNWQSSDNGASIYDSHVKQPLIFPSATTTYHVAASLGHCKDSGSITVNVSPYPSVIAGNDTTICHGTGAVLSAVTNAAYFSWNEDPYLLHRTSLTPDAYPQVTTAYIVTVKDTFFCPKPVSDTMIVTVVPPIVVNAGNDTSVVINQPLQLNATSSTNSVNFTWTPSVFLNNPLVANPVAVIGSDEVEWVEYHVTASTNAGCKGSDSILVKIFSTQPELFVPSAFTPNGDGRNDLIKPIPAGIAHFNYFRIYNRWGQLMFATTQPGAGWDGTLNGSKQPTATYIYAAEGTDYKGRVISRKGTIVLIR